MNKKILAGIVSLFVCCGLCVLIGCTGNGQKIAIKYGTKTETTKTLTLTNTTGQDITGVTVQLVGDTASKELEASGNDVWSNESTAEIYLDEAAGSSANTQSGDIKLRAAYNITMLLKDGTPITVHNLTQAGVEDYKDAKLRINDADKVAYIEYTDPTGATASTLASEQQILADQKAAAEAERAKRDTSLSGSGGYAGSGWSSQGTDDCTGGNIKLR